MAIRKRTSTDSPAPVPVLHRPAPAAAEFDGSEAVDGYAVLRWETTYGGIGLAHPLRDSNGSLRRLVAALRERHGANLDKRYAAVAVAQGAWRTSISHSPRLDARDLQADDDESTNEQYEATWQQLATVLGAPAPYWPPTLRDPETIHNWRPGTPPALVPACHMTTPVAHLTALAADEPDGSAAAQVCLWLARTIRHRDHRAAQNHIKTLQESAAKGRDSAHLTLGAMPAPYQRDPDEEQPSEKVRRAGWLEITARRDALAHRVAHLVQAWDGGGDWHTGAHATIHPNWCATAREWAQRLKPTPRDQPPSVLERELLANSDDPQRDELLHDPVTGLPALRRRREPDPSETITTMALQRLATLSPLHSIILSGETVWIRTDDGTLWLAPERDGDGINWGYNGSGPHTLAQLLDRLLDDISAPALDSDGDDPPPGLHKLMVSTPQDGATTYTRAQLLAAREA